MPILLQNETVITQSGKQDVVLTNFRIYKNRKRAGKSYYQSIMLEHITSCEDVYKSYVWLLGISILSFLVAGYLMFTNFKNEIGISLFIGIIFLIVYLVTRSHVIIISSPSTKIYIKVTGMNNNMIKIFLGQVDQSIIDKQSKFWGKKLNQ